MTVFLDNILGRLARVRRSGRGWVALCPNHDDKAQSLSVCEEDGKVLLHCFAGCAVEDVCQAIGIEMRELFEGRGTDSTPSPQSCNGAAVTVVDYAAAKKLPLDFIKSLGLSDLKYQGRMAVRIPYLDENGNELAVRIRTALDKSGEDDNRFRWKRGSKPFLYGLWRKQGPDYRVLCEGESDCHTLWHHGFPALGVPGATNWNEDRDAAKLDRFARIYVVIEPDKGGAAVQNWLAKSKLLDRAYLLSLNGFKDPSALHLDNPTQFKSQFEAAMKAAVPALQVLAGQRATEAEEARRLCKQIAESSSILDHFAEALRARGVVGEERTAKVLYLALVTRFLQRPVSVAVKGPSSGGKSFVTEQVLRFFPESAVYCLTAMSDRALAYTEADLRNRFLVVYEATGISGDFASYLIRTMLSEGRLVYEVVEKTANGLKPRRIEKEGPTGLLVTTTAVRLHPENETRLLSLLVTDSQEQTREVLRAIVKGSQAATDLTSWVALQTWLESAEHRVVIPFATHLAELIPAIAVRLRRDFGALLALVSAHAILHQASRCRGVDGRIVATLKDYAIVRELVSDIVSQGVEATVTPAARETVEAVKLLLDRGGAEVALSALAKYLKLDKSATSRRVASAVQQGYLKNLEDRKGHPARLMLGDALPEGVDLLPAVEVLQRCSVEAGVYTSLPALESRSEAGDPSKESSAEYNPSVASIGGMAGRGERVIEVEI